MISTNRGDTIMLRAPESIDRRGNERRLTATEQMFRRAIELFVDFGIPCGFVSAAERLPSGAIRDLDADGHPIKPTALILPANDEFRRMLPLGEPAPNADNPHVRQIVAPGIDPRVITAMKNVNRYQVGIYGEDDPRTPYLDSMNAWTLDMVRAREANEWMMFSEVDPQEALALVVISALAHGVGEGTLKDMFVDKMDRSGRSDKEKHIIEGLMHAAFVGLNAKR